MEEKTQKPGQAQPNQEKTDAKDQAPAKESPGFNLVGSAGMHDGTHGRPEKNPPPGAGDAQSQLGSPKDTNNHPGDK